MKRQSMIFIELDGASWNVLDPLIQKGRLPNLQRLMQNGVYGDLLSDPPLISPRLWVSIFTGKHSKKHGLEFFGNSSAMVKCKRIWDILQDADNPVGVFGSFVTWPPYPLSGFMIPSLFSLGAETYPEEYGFFQELILNERRKGKETEGAKNGKNGNSLLYYSRKLREHGVGTGTLAAAALDFAADKIKRSPRDERYWKRATAHLKISTEFFIHLHRKHRPTFSTVHIHLCDALSHRYWKYYEPEKFHDVNPRLVEKYRSVIPDAYEEADRMIGRMLAEVGDAVVMVMSDHGSTAMESARTAYRLHVERHLDRFGLRDKVVPANVGLMTFSYFHDAELMRRMAAAFEKVVFADTGERVFDLRQEDALIGLRLSQSFWEKEIPGDRMIDLGSFGRCRFDELFLLQKMEVSGTHQREGMFIMSGPGIRRGGQRISGAEIFDITPTALALLGLPVGRDMDGKVLTNALEADFLEAHPVRWIESHEEARPRPAAEIAEVGYDQVKDRLQSLGYL